MYCVHCGTAMAPGVRACGRCGTPAAVPGTPAASGGPGKAVLVAALAAGCLFVAVPIVGILAAIAVPNFLNAAQRGKQLRTMADIRSVGVALEAYAVDRGRVFPDVPPEGLASLRPLLEPTYVARLPLLDAWQNPIEYTSDGGSYTLRSRGKDGVADAAAVPGPTASFDADILFSDGRFVSWPDGTQP